MLEPVAQLLHEPTYELCVCVREIYNLDHASSLLPIRTM